MRTVRHVVRSCNMWIGRTLVVVGVVGVLIGGTLHLAGSKDFGFWTQVSGFATVLVGTNLWFGWRRWQNAALVDIVIGCAATLAFYDVFGWQRSMGVFLLLIAAGVGLLGLLRWSGDAASTDEQDPEELL
jgi:hypothetical protein